MKIDIPGFPDAVTNHLELPDIGELLMYPAFQCILAEDFWKYATEFQKYLFQQIPLCHDKRGVTIRSGVWLLEPGIRSHVSGTGVHGWHIDGATDFDHRSPNERVFILSSPCSSLTEFNSIPLKISSPDTETRQQFSVRVDQNADEFGVAGKPIEPCRIYRFQNHLHRAVEPLRVEFRYFLRVRETDLVDDLMKRPLTKVMVNEPLTRTQRLHIEYESARVCISIPSAMARRPGPQSA